MAMIHASIATECHTGLRADMIAFSATGRRLPSLPWYLKIMREGPTIAASFATHLPREDMLHRQSTERI